MPLNSKPYCFFISTSWNKGAVSQHFRCLANMLAKRGHRVVILVGANKKTIECKEGNPAVFSWPSIRPTRVQDAIFLMKLILKFRPDCLIANFAAVNIMMLVGWLMRVAQRISWNHTISSALSIDYPYQKWKVKYYRIRKNIVYRLCTYIVSNSEAARSDLISVYSIHKNKCEVFYNSLKDPLIMDNIIDVSNNGLMKLACVARLSLSKGQDILIRAIRLLQDKYPELTVHFIGEGPFRDYYMQLASELNVVERCVFRGELPYGEVLKEMALSSATVCPSRSEAFGFVNIESMAVGTPVIASAVGGIPELIRDGEDGFLVPPEDPVGLAEKIDVLISNPHLRQTMGRKARQNYLNRFEQGKLLLQLSQWLESIVC